MDLLDQYLAPDERVLFRTRLHPVIFGSAAFFAAFVMAVVALIVTRNELEPGTVRLLWLIAALIVAVSFVSPTLRWRQAEFVLTDRRLLARFGLFSAHVVEALLAKGAMRVDQGLWGRLLGYGTLRLGGRGGAIEVFSHVGRPIALREAVARHAPGSLAARGRRG